MPKTEAGTDEIFVAPDLPEIFIKASVPVPEKCLAPQLQAPVQLTPPILDSDSR